MLPAILRSPLITSPYAFAWFVQPPEQDVVKFEGNEGGKSLKSITYNTAMEAYRVARVSMLEIRGMDGSKYALTPKRIHRFHDTENLLQLQGHKSHVIFRGTSADCFFELSVAELTKRIFSAGLGRDFLQLQYRNPDNRSSATRVVNFSDCSLETVKNGGTKVSRREQTTGPYFAPYEIPQTPDQIEAALAKRGSFTYVPLPGGVGS